MDSISPDVLRRLNRALPELRHWIDNLLAEHGSVARSLDSLGSKRLLGYFPNSLLQAARIAVVPRIPFPPVAALGLPELQAMSTMPLGGITFWDIFFVLDSQLRESICFHELIHVVQWQALGVDDFLLTYGLGLLQHGYEESPLEAMASTAQGLFDSGSPIPALVEKVAAHASTERAAAVALYARNGIRMGA